MKWIKASERLPGKTRVNIKYYGNANVMYNYQNNGWAFDDQDGKKIFPVDFEHIEWLDETESPTPPEGKGYSLQQVADTWDAANDYAKEREDYRYGKRGPFQYPNKETFIASLPPQPVKDDLNNISQQGEQC